MEITQMTSTSNKIAGLATEVNRSRSVGVDSCRSLNDFSKIGAEPASSEISDLCKISDLLLFFSCFASQNKEIKHGNCFFGVCCVN